MMLTPARSLALLAAMAAGSAAAQQPAPGDPPPARADLHAPFDAILRAHVRDGLVDYLTIRDTAWDELTGYLGALDRTDPNELAGPERLAFYLNLYNATVIRAVAERLVAGYTPAERDFAVFDEPLVRLGGASLSLNQLEHELIRPRFREPRIHVALVCGARSCPPLPPRAWRGATLDADLDARVRAFLADPERNRLDERPIRVSRIFDWYAADFGDADGLRAWLERYAGALGSAEIAFLDYSWELNLAQPRTGTWVAVAAGEHEGRIARVVAAEGDRLELELPFGGGRLVLPRRQTAQVWPNR